MTLWIGILALVVAVISAAISAVSVVYTRQQAHQARRSADIQHAAELRARTAEQAAEIANSVRWRVVRTEAGHALINAGTNPARNVHAWTNSTVILAGPLIHDPSGTRQFLLAQSEVKPGAAIHFTLAPRARDMGSGNEMLVTWAGHDDPVAVPLPEVVDRA